MKRPLLAASLAALLVLPAACQPKEKEENLPELIKSKLAESDASLRNHKSDEAAEGYKWVLEKEPGNVAALTGLGKVELEREDYAAAIDPLTKAVAANGEDADARVSLGRAHVGNGGDYASAVEHLGKAWELDKEQEQYGMEYGVALRETGKYDEARAVLEEVAEMNPKLKYVYRELGKTEQAAGDLDKALRTFMKAQTQWAGDQDAFLGASQVYEAKGEIPKAVDQLAQYIQQDCCSTYSKEHAQPKLKELKELENAAPMDGGDAPADG